MFEDNGFDDNGFDDNAFDDNAFEDNGFEDNGAEEVWFVEDLGAGATRGNGLELDQRTKRRLSRAKNTCTTLNPAPMNRCQSEIVRA